MDPVRRTAYDKHGELGLTVVENAIIDYDHEHEIQEKINKLVDKNYRKALIHDVNPRTNITLGLSCSEYFDSLGKPKVGNMPMLMLSSFQIHELIKVNYTDKLSGDIGFVTHTKGGAGVSCLISRLTWGFGAGYIATASVQTGDKNTGSLSI
jgi:hypothetical protein